MEVKQGYKYTEEFGYIPEDWEVNNINDIAKLKARIGWQGLTTQEYLTKGKYYLISGVDFKNYRVNWENCYFVNFERWAQDKNIQVKNEDILITKDGTIGKVAIVENFQGKATLNSGVFVVRAKKIYNSYFLFYILTSFYFDNFLIKLQAGSTILHLYQKDFITFLFPLPSIQEQEKIAQVLRDMDKLIESIEDLLEKKRNLKIAAMQKLLTPQPHWEKKRMGEFTQICTGKENNENKVDNGLYPFFVRSDRIERINHYAFDGEAILIPGEGGIGKIFHYINGKFNYHQRVYKISHINLNGKFLFYYLKKYFGAYALSNTVKATVDSLRLDTFQGFNVLFPSLQEQQKIAQILSDMDEEIDALEKELEKYRLLKTGAMQELLTGKTRLL